MAAALAGLLALPPLSAQIIFHEGFETDGEGIRYHSTGSFSNGKDDYFIRTDLLSGPSALPAYTGFGGDWFWAAEDVDGPLNPSGITYLDFYNIAITGLSQIQISIDMAAGSTAAFDSLNDFVFVKFRVDQSPWDMALAFQNDGTRFNTGMHQDFNFDGIGTGTVLTLDFATFFSEALIVQGDFLDIRIDVLVDAGGETIAFDNITVTAVPEPGSIALCFGLIAVLIATRTRRRQPMS